MVPIGKQGLSMTHQLHVIILCSESTVVTGVGPVSPASTLDRVIMVICVKHVILFTRLITKQL